MGNQIEDVAGHGYRWVGRGPQAGDNARRESARGAPEPRGRGER
jgi:hypothetical protein